MVACGVIWCLNLILFTYLRHNTQQNLLTCNTQLNDTQHQHSALSAIILKVAVLLLCRVMLSYETQHDNEHITSQHNYNQHNDVQHYAI
jgi:hypothetical protein